MKLIFAVLYVLYKRWAIHVVIKRKVFLHLYYMVDEEDQNDTVRGQCSWQTVMIWPTASSG